jgi:hypothetical protein
MEQEAAKNQTAMHEAGKQEASALEKFASQRKAELAGAVQMQVETARDDVRKTAGEELAEFDRVARTRAKALEDVLKHQTELVGRITDLHESTSGQLEEARTLAKAVQHSAQERIAEIDAAGARQLQAIGESAAVVEKLRAEMAQLESTATERLGQLDHMVRDRHADIQAVVQQKLTAFSRQAEEAEASVSERIAALDRRAQETGARFETRVARLDQEADEQAAKREGALASAASRHEASLRALADDHQRELHAAGEAKKKELLAVLSRTGTALEGVPGGSAEQLGEMVAAARASLEQVADDRIEGMEAIAAAIRRGANDLEQDIAAALQQSGERQAEMLDRAASSWLNRIERASRRRRRAGWRRRAAPPVTAVMLAIAAAFGGSLFGRAGGDSSTKASGAVPAHGATAQPPGHVNLSPVTVASEQPAPDPISWTAPSPGAPAGASAPSASRTASGASGSTGGGTTRGSAAAAPAPAPAPAQSQSAPPAPTAPSQPSQAVQASSPVQQVVDPVLNTVNGLTGH